MSAILAEGQIPVLMNNDSDQLIGEAKIYAEEDGSVTMTIKIPKYISSDFVHFITAKSPKALSFICLAYKKDLPDDE